MDPLKFAMLGAGFWGKYQLAAWKEFQQAECVAVCDPVRAKAEVLAQSLGVPRVYHDVETLLDSERLDFVDIVSSVETHRMIAELAADRRLDVISQKPIAPSLADADKMRGACRAAGVSLYIHENWRWQRPIRELRNRLSEGAIGRPVRARITFITAFDDYASQPFLRQLEQLILTDTGTHIFDTARFLFGEFKSVYCVTRRVGRDLKGEDLATVLLKTDDDMAVTCEMGVARIPMEHDIFPQTMVVVEGEKGTAELAANYWIRVTTSAGTNSHRFPPPRYAWADPEFEVVHASLVPCIGNLLGALRGEGTAETTGDDNFETLRLVHAAYDSAAQNEAIRMDQYEYAGGKQASV